MPNKQDHIKHLLIKLEVLEKQQAKFSQDIQSLRKAIAALEQSERTTNQTTPALAPIKTKVDIDVWTPPTSTPKAVHVPIESTEISEPIKAAEPKTKPLPSFELFPNFKADF